MASRQPLARRIVIAFTLLTLLVSGLFATAIVMTVHEVEEDIVTEELSNQMTAALLLYKANGRLPDFGAGTQFHADGLTHEPLPEGLAGVREGFTEIDTGPRAYYVYRRDEGGRHFLLIRNQDEFEAREEALYIIVFVGFFVSVALAWFIGRLTARRVIDPVVSLAQQVRGRDQLLPLAPQLAPDYPDDEVGELARAFDGALAQLHAALDRERLFTSDVSHELRTPLMIIATSSELLATKSLGAKELRLVERIQRAADEMRELVQTFLLLARAESGNAQQAGVASVAEVAEEQAALWGEEMRAKGLDFELLGLECGSARYHRTYLRVVIGNLLRNALHYTDHGYVRLIVESGGVRVEDSGIGIPDADKAAMFESFVRGARGEGLGLGLSLVRRICRQAGWTISVHNQQPQGSCFKVRFLETV